jgi:hypothetical protein
MGLRIRRADAAPGIGAEELFGRIPESVITDRDLSDGAVRQYAAIRLSMVESGNPKICLATMGELAELQGITDREARRRTAELEARGHIARERVRTISGSPQGIRPLAALKPPRTDPSTRTKRSDCNRTTRSVHPDQTVRQTGPSSPPNRTAPSGTLKREGETEEQQQSAASCDGSVVALSAPPQSEEPELPSRANFLGGSILSLVADLAEALDLSAAKSPGATSAKKRPGAKSRESIPDVVDSTTSPNPASRDADQIEHNRD